MIAVSFVGPNNLQMSGLMASRLYNLNPVPDEIIFITPDVEKLKAIHGKLYTRGIPIKYLQDDYVSNLVGMDTKIQELGWLSRQWIQLHLDLIVQNSKFILTCDADLIVNRPLRLFNNVRINYFVETEPHYEPYFITMKTLLPKLTEFLPKGESFNSEIMVLVPEQLKNLRTALNINHKDWFDLCVKNMPKGCAYAFSEYETIGTWMLNHCANKINLVKSDTYNNNMRFGGKHKLSDLIKMQSVIPLRSVTDKDIDWYN